MAFQQAGKYADFLDPDLIKFGQQGSTSFGAASKPQTEMGELLSFWEKINSPDARKQALADKLQFDKEQMRAAYPYLLAREFPGQVARAVNPMADPATAAIVLSSFQRGQEGIENIVRGIPQLSQSGSQIGFVPSGRYFRESQG